MPSKRYPTEKQIRTALIQRIDAFIKVTGLTKSSVGKEAVGDPAFVGRLFGGNFTVTTYGRVMKFLDDNWPRRSAKARRS